jgi:hypothetical protein
MAGGYSPSMLEAMRAAVVNTKAVRMQTLSQQTLARELGARDHAVLQADPDTDLMDYRGAFWLATKGGALALGLQVYLRVFPLYVLHNFRYCFGQRGRALLGRRWCGIYVSSNLVLRLQDRALLGRYRVW